MLEKKDLTVKLTVALDGSKKGQVIKSNPELSPSSAEDVLFAPGANKVIIGGLKYQKVSDITYCEFGPKRELKYVQVD